VLPARGCHPGIVNEPFEKWGPMLTLAQPIYRVGERHDIVDPITVAQTLIDARKPATDIRPPLMVFHGNRRRDRLDACRKDGQRRKI
jgi:hypothetical protein